jgi:5-methylcytosine-specific restriction endonuclease McrA
MGKVGSTSKYYWNDHGVASRPDVTRFLYSVQGGVCLICGLYMRRRDATIDHVVPLGKGGAHSIKNWALAHASCNQTKADHLPTEQELARHRLILRRANRAIFRLRVGSAVGRLLSAIGLTRSKATTEKSS